MEFQAVLDAVRSLPVDDQAKLMDMIQDDLLGADLLDRLSNSMINIMHTK